MTWTAPASNGGSAVTGYVVTPFIGGVAQTAQTFNSTATTETVTGLTVGASYTFKVAAINAAGTGPASAASGSVTINSGPSLTFAAPPAGEVSIAYSNQLTATGGTGALTWSVSSGSLPPGLTLNASTGLLSGTPTTAGSYAFTVKIADTAGGIATKAATITIAAAPSLANPAPPSGQAAVAYSDALSVTGGTGPFTWAVSGGSLPAGLTLNASTGVLSGTPTAEGLYSFTVKVTDSKGLSATQGLSMTVMPGPLVITAAANTSTVTQGGTAAYTVRITNTAASAYSGVTYSIPLADLLDDAAYNSDASATSGTVTFAAQTLTWTGNLAAGATATVTFSVTVDNPYTGDGALDFTVTSPTTGTNCPPSTTDARCSASASVAALTITQTPSVTAAVPGAVVRYTVTVTNSGATAYTGAALTDPLAGVLDDAVYNGDAAATAGAASFSSPNLTWTGNLAAGATATITFSATVNNPDTGNKILTSTITSASSGTNCSSGSTDARCTAAVTVQGLTIASTASTASATPGATVQYTVTVTNTGQASYTGASVGDSLAGVLDDAVYNGDAAATSGSLSYSSPNLTWTGDLPAGATATITFSVTVNDPDTGNKVLTTAVTSPTPASNCPAGGTDPACSTKVAIQVPNLAIALSSSVSTTTPGSTVHYTETVTDSGQTSYTGISAAVSLAGVLDDAAYNGDASATGGSVSFASPSLNWTGSLSPGGSVTVTFSVTVNDPDTGSKILSATVTTATAGANCTAGSTDSNCSSTVQVLVPGLDFSVTANTAATTAGSTVQYTVTASNTGQTTQTGVSFTDSLAGVLDDAAYNGDASATAGSVSFTSPNVTWTGTLAPGATATVTFSVTVNSPDTGDKVLSSMVTSAARGSNCAVGSTDPDCSATVTVSSLAITNVASPTTVTPGGVVRYTGTFTNTGQTPYHDITVASDASDVFDDAVPNGDQTATSGTLMLTSTGISWTGDIPAGGTVTVTGTVTVRDPDAGNKAMTSTLVTSAPGSNCPAGGTDPACTATVNVRVPGLTIVQTANVPAATPGSAVQFTVTVTNSGQAPYTGAVAAVSFAKMAGDAVYNGDAAATTGSLSYAAPVLTWTGDLSPGDTATITYSVTVASPDNGNKLVITSASSAAVGSSCPPGTSSAPCQLTIPVLTPALTITSTANSATAVPGGTVQYTVTIADTGQTPYAGATVADDLTGVLDDASYNGDASATAGSVSFASPNVTWTGSLNPGDSATVTFSVTVNNPDTGDEVLSSTVTSAVAGSNCASGSTDARCAATVDVESAALLTIAVTSDVASASAGGVVHYTVTVNNAAATPYTGATFADSLAGVLDDASYNGDASASAGAVSYASPTLTWTGSLNPGDSATVTFTVTVDNPDTGNKILATTATSSAPGNNCAAGSTDPGCATSVPVSVLEIVNSASVTTVTPGGTVGYTVTVTNSGQAPVSGGTLTIPLTDVLDDAVYNDNAAATAGTVSFTSPDLTWAGTLAAGATASITFSVTVSDPDTGNKALQDTVTSATPGSTCPASGSAPAACTAAVTVQVPGLTITTSASSSTTTPGSVVQYTISVANTGQSSYTGVAVTDNLTSLLDDSDYNSDAAATAGTVAYASPTLTWTGDLAPGDTATITFSITVDNPDNGDKHMVNPVVSTAQGSTCPPGGADPACTTTVTDLIPGLTITKTANLASATPGSAVDYTITVTDSGQTSYAGAVVTDDLTGVLNAAAYNGDGAATVGAVSYASPTLTWTGDLAPGDTATITYSVTIDNPATGGASITNTVTSAAVGSSCPSGASGSECTVTTGIISGPLSITAPASADLGSGAPGGTIQASLGTVQVTDGRGFGADWSAAVSSSNFSAGGPAETIPVSDASYAISGLNTATGPATFGFVPELGLSGNPQDVVNATNVNGNTTVTWNPVIKVAVPAGAIGGSYSATIVHSVS